MKQGAKKKTPSSSQPKSILRRGWKWTIFCAVGLSVFAAGIFGFYYIRTPSETLVVVPTPFPSNWSPGFTEEQLGDFLLSSIQEIRLNAKSQYAEGIELGPQIALPDSPYVPWRVRLPSFDQKVRTVDVNMLRQWALSAKAKFFLTLNATKATDNGLRLNAVLTERPYYTVQRSWTVPSEPKSCQRPETCTDELAEGILGFRERHTLILYYMNKKARDAFEKIVRLYELEPMPQMTPTDYYAWGDALQGLKRYDEAINQFNEALMLDHNFCDAYDAIGITYISKYEGEELGKYLDGAEIAYHKALACNPRDAVAHCNLVNVLIRKWRAGNFRDDRLKQAAIAENERALEMDPKLAEAAVNLAYVKYWEGSERDSFAYFDTISQRFPDSAALFANFGYLLFREYVNGKSENKTYLQKALDKTNTALKLDNESFIIDDNLAFLYYETGFLSQAVQLWEKAYELQPTSPDILAGSALGLFKQGKPVEAISRYCEAVRRDDELRIPAKLQAKYSWSLKASRDIKALQRAARQCDE